MSVTEKKKKRDRERRFLSGGLTCLSEKHDARLLSGGLIAPRFIFPPPPKKKKKWGNFRIFTRLRSEDEFCDETKSGDSNFIQTYPDDDNRGVCVAEAMIF